MAAPASRIYHGNWNDGPVVIRRSIRQRQGEMDTAALGYVSKLAAGFNDGAAVPGLSGFYFEDIDERQLGGKFEYDCTAVGLLGGAAKRAKGYPQPTVNLEDWDTVSDQYLTTNPNHFTVGSVTSAYGGVVICTSRLPTPVIGGIYRVTGTFRGIISDKPRSRTISVNQQVISGDAIYVNLPGGWTTPRKGTASLPKVQVTDRYITTSAPPTNVIPGNATPPNAPAVKILTVSGTDVTRHWPGGWRMASVSGQQIGGSSLWENEISYEYAYPVTP